MDESGNAGDRRGHYVLGCLVGGPGGLARLADRLYHLKLGMAPGRDPDSWEIHSSKIMSGHSPVGARNERKKLEALGAIVETICRSDVTLFGVAIVNKMINRHESNTSMHYAFTFILERLELFLRTCDGKTGNIVADRMRRGTSRKAARLFNATTRGYNRFSHIRVERIVGLEYVSSLYSPLTQLADVVAYVIRRHMEGDERFANMFEMLMSKMWNDGEWHGWKVLPG